MNDKTIYLVDETAVQIIAKIIAKIAEESKYAPPVPEGFIECMDATNNKKKFLVRKD